MTLYDPIPGYHVPGSVRTPQLHRVRSVAGVLVGMLAGTVVTALASGIASQIRASRIEAFIDDDGTFEAVETADVWVNLIGIAHVLVLVATAVFFLIWSWRMYANARVVAPDKAPRAGWAIGGWFIPVVQFVLPALQLARVDRISGTDGRGARPLILGWAVVFAAANVYYRTVWGSPVFPIWNIFLHVWFGTNRPLQSIQAADREEIWAQLLFALAAGLAILMVRVMTHRQEQLLIARHQAQLAYLADREARIQQGPPPGYSAPINPNTDWSVPPPHPNAPPAPDQRTGERGPG